MLHNIIDFNQWHIDEEHPFGSGASEKIWLKNNSENKKGIFKYPKITTYNTITGEYWSEKLASEIAKLVGIECADIDMGIYDDRKGSMSYLFLKENEILIEGIQYISQKYPTYDQDKFKDIETSKVYSIQMIVDALDGEGNLIENFFKISVFDCLIGNSDRHHSNWGIVKNETDNTKRIAPLYDNGSSLCSYVNEGDIDSYLRDSTRFNALFHTKSKSRIGWEDKKKIRHFELLEKLRDNYYQYTIETVQSIKANLGEEAIDNLIYNFSDDIISEKMKKLLKKYLLAKRKKILDTYNL